MTGQPHFPPHLYRVLPLFCTSTFYFLSRWSKFHGDLNNYKKKLESALVVHALIRELEEVRDRASEKVSDPELLESCRSDFFDETKRTVSWCCL